MIDAPAWLALNPDNSLVLTVYVQPKASQTKVVGIHGDALKISVTAPPVEGKANAALIKFLAKLLGIPKSAITIQSGEQGRTKRFLLRGLPLRDALSVIEQTFRT